MCGKEDEKARKRISLKLFESNYDLSSLFYSMREAVLLYGFNVILGEHKTLDVAESKKQRSCFKFLTVVTEAY